MRRKLGRVESLILENLVDGRPLNDRLHPRIQPANVAVFVRDLMQDGYVGTEFEDGMMVYRSTQAGRFAIDAHLGRPHSMADAPDEPILVYARWTWDGHGAEGEDFSWRVAEKDNGAITPDGDQCTRFRAVKSNPYTDWSTDPLGWLPLPGAIEERQ